MRVVSVRGNGKADNPRRPDVAEGVAYEVVEDRGDTMLVKVDELTEARAEVDALKAEVQGIRDRVAAVEVGDPDAQKVRDAVAGNGNS